MVGCTCAACTNGPKKCALIPKSLHEEPSGIYWRNDGHFPPLHSDQQLLFGCLGQTWHFDLCLLFTATNSSEMTAWARYGTLTFFEIYLLLLYVLAWLIYSKCCNFVFWFHEEPLGIYWRNGWLFPSWIALLSQAHFLASFGFLGQFLKLSHILTCSQCLVMSLFLGPTRRLWIWSCPSFFASTLASIGMLHWIVWHFAFFKCPNVVFLAYV